MKLPKTQQVELFHYAALHPRRGGGGVEDHNTLFGNNYDNIMKLLCRYVNFYTQTYMDA